MGWRGSRVWGGPQTPGSTLPLHPQTPVLPPTITDQIRLWELERDRLRFSEGEERGGGHLAVPTVGGGGNVAFLGGVPRAFRGAPPRGNWHP